VGIGLNEHGWRQLKKYTIVANLIKEMAFNIAEYGSAAEP